MNTTSRQRRCSNDLGTLTTPPRRHRRTRAGAAAAASLGALCLALAGCAGQAQALDDDVSAAGVAVTLGYTGGVQQYAVTTGATSLTVVAAGGSGGDSHVAG